MFTFQLVRLCFLFYASFWFRFLHHHSWNTRDSFLLKFAFRQCTYSHSFVIPFWIHVICLDLCYLTHFGTHHGLFLHLYKTKQYIDVFLKSVFVCICLFPRRTLRNSGRYSVGFQNTIQRQTYPSMLIQIQAQNFLTLSGSCIGTIPNRALQVFLILCMNFFSNVHFTAHK